MDVTHFIFLLMFSFVVQILKEFLCFAEAEVRSLASLYSGVVCLLLLLLRVAFLQMFTILNHSLSEFYIDRVEM